MPEGCWLRDLRRSQLNVRITPAKRTFARVISFGSEVPDQKSAGRSLRLDVCRLDDRPPLLDFSLLLRGKRLRRLFLARPDFLTHVDEPPPYRRIGQGLYDRRVELADDIPGRVLGSPKAVPE